MPAVPNTNNPIPATYFNHEFHKLPAYDFDGIKEFEKVILIAPGYPKNLNSKDRYVVLIVLLSLPEELFRILKR